MSGRAYPRRPVAGVGVVVLRGAAVLLVRRGQPPKRGQWSLPGGAQELGETAEAAARRELLEETGVRVGRLVLAGQVDLIERDQAGRPRYHYSIVDYAGVWLAGDAMARSDAAALAWAEADTLQAFGLDEAVVRVIEIARGLLA